MLKISLNKLFAAAGLSLFLLSLTSDLMAQGSESNFTAQRDFGWSLEKIDKEKAKSIQQPVVSRVENNSDLIRVDTTLVVNEILVLDKHGSVIHGLNQADFVVNEDSVPQDIEVFALSAESRIPRSIVLIIDYSGSQLPYIPTSVEAAKILVDKLHPNDQMALVTDDVELLSGFTSDKEFLKEKLDSLNARVLTGKTGKSEQYSALMATLNELFHEGVLRPVILFQTDGDQLSTFAGRSGEGFNRSGLKKLLSAAEGNGATIYTIIPGPSFTVRSWNEQRRYAKAEIADFAIAHARFQKQDSSNAKKSNPSSDYISQWANSRRRDQLALKYVSDHTGGGTAYLATPQDADQIYSHILSKMNQRYLIGYYPTNEEKNGKRRKVEIIVRDHSDYVIWGRKTYIAQGGREK